MKIEIERKFLVDPVRLPRINRESTVIQAYLSTDPEVRVRIQDKKSHLTIKTKGSISRQEFEYKIPLREAKLLIKLSNLVVLKKRFFLGVNGFVWVIDFYQGENKGLVVAEIELEKENQKFEKPLWAIREVTHDLRYKNANLAAKPFSSWPKL